MRCLVGVALASVYGLAWRAAAERDVPGADVMSLAFLFAVPFVMGVLSVLPVRGATLAHALALPTIASTITLGVTMAAGWEGLICVAMALVPLLGLAILGALIVLAVWGAHGLLVRRRARRAQLGTAGEPHDGPGSAYSIALLPLLLAPLERGFDAPLDVRVVRTSIEIAAPPSVVWEEIVDVRAIEVRERRPALFTAIGFPHPVSARLDDRRVGGVREATFEGGVLFLERVTRFEPERALEFEIDAQEHLIPPTTLDPHVTIGGPFFDVLHGAYRIEARSGGVVLHLASELRVSTRFNAYAGPWADLVMESIQSNILEIVRARCERR